jgi:cyclophilin family peptidyl-prolyl cis-trans isomerase
LQTSIGNLNLELHCDIAMRTTWNFITLCERGYYDGISFHRLIPGFMLQGGDPSGTGSGGDSAWGKGKPFRDQFDARILHDSRGILSMANSGIHSNKAQFFITLKATSHLDYKHSVFGKLVGGGGVLDRIEAVGSDKKEKPLQEIMLLKATVFTNPIEEADRLLLAEITVNIKTRTESEIKLAMATNKGNLHYDEQAKIGSLTAGSSSSTARKSSSILSENLITLDSSIDSASNTTTAPESSSSPNAPIKAPVEPNIGKYMQQAKSEAKSEVKMDNKKTSSNSLEFDNEIPYKKLKTIASPAFKNYDDFSGW